MTVKDDMAKFTQDAQRRFAQSYGEAITEAFKPFNKAVERIGTQQRKNMSDETVAEIGDEHRDRVWRDRNGDYWKWYEDGERRGWKYQSPYNRWRFGGMHIPDCGPYTLIGHRTPEDDEDFT